MKTVILSFDYELFFGNKSGSVKKSIIEPTNLLLDTMEDVGLRGNFFVDYLMLKKFESMTDDNVRSDLMLLKTQLRDIVRRGHRIELHLHPHWIDAIYNGDGTWNFDNYEHYSLASLEENEIDKLFYEGVRYLEGILREIDPNYKICAFRAGGWAIQPFSKLKKSFTTNNILIDSSSSYGLYEYYKDYFYDFRNAPNKCIYRFEDDVCIEKSNGSFVEIPITSYSNNIFFKFYDSFIYKHTKNFKTFADGNHNREDKSFKEVSFFKRVLIKCRPGYKKMLNFSSITRVTILYLLITRRDEIFCFIDHPKDVCYGTIKGINFIGKFCKSVNYIDLV